MNGDNLIALVMSLGVFFGVAFAFFMAWITTVKKDV